MVSISRDVFEHHIDYAAWASARLVEAADRLTEDELTRDFGTADKSVLGTLVHVFAADRIWMRRVEGQAPASFVTEADHQLSVLQNDWPVLHENWRQWTAALTDATAAEEIA